KPVSDRALDGAINRAEERRLQAMQASMNPAPAAAPLNDKRSVISVLGTRGGVKCGDHLTVMAAEEGVDDEVHYNTSAVSLLVEELRKQSPVIVVDVPRKAAAARAAVLAA